MMKPYPFQNPSMPEKAFNGRLSPARRIIENSFGIAAARFRIFLQPINAKVSTVKSVTKAIVALHNFLMYKNQHCPPNYVDSDGPQGVIPGKWHDEESSIMGLRDVDQLGSNNYSKHAKVIRDEFRECFTKEGAVEWQWDIVNKVNQHNITTCKMT